jgi:outer membrane protein assembly factor BamB
MPVVMVLLMLLPPAMVEGGGADSGTVAVMFYYGPEEYYWSSATADGSADAVAVSKIAADNMNRAFVYDDATGAVEIGGLRPGANDTWNWSLLSWDTINERWAPWAGGPHGLKPLPGWAIAWSPNTTANPTPNPLSRHPWPMDRCGAARRGETLSPAPMTNLTWWTAALNELVIASPCVAAGKVFIRSDSDLNYTNPSVSCLDEADGRLLWKTRIGAATNASEGSVPAYYDGKLFVGSNNGVMRALSAVNGSVLWEFSAGPSEFAFSSPAIWRDRIVFSGGDGCLYSLTPDGKLAWRANLTADPDGLGEPAILDDRVVVGTWKGRLHCVDFRNGSEVWNISLNGSVQGAPALAAEGYAFVPATVSRAPDNRTVSMNLYSVYLRDGTIQYNTSYPLSWSSPALSAGGLFIGTETEFVGHHPDRGTRMWGLPYDAHNAGPAVAKGYVYFNVIGDIPLVCANAAGNQVWTFAPLGWKERPNGPGNWFSPPVVADGRLFSVTGRGVVYCLGRPPEARVGATLSAPAKATEGSKVTVKASFNNTGEAPALFTAYLTVDGNRTGLKKGPFTLQPGEKMNISLEWKAVKGNHTLGLAYNGTAGKSTPAHIEVAKPAEACSSVIWTTALAAVALVVPSVVKWDGRRKR